MTRLNQNFDKGKNGEFNYTKMTRKTATRVKIRSFLIYSTEDNKQSLKTSMII